MRRLNSMLGSERGGEGRGRRRAGGRGGGGGGGWHEKWTRLLWCGTALLRHRRCPRGYGGVYIYKSRCPCSHLFSQPLLNSKIRCNCGIYIEVVSLGMARGCLMCTIHTAVRKEILDFSG